MIDFRMTDGCQAKIDSLFSQISLLPRGLQGLIFAVDNGPGSDARMYTVGLPVNLEQAQTMFHDWNDQPLGDVVKSTRDLSRTNADILLNLETVCNNLSCWLVAWSHRQGISLEEQVRLSDSYAHLFVVQGKQYTFCRANVGPRLSESAS